jgi:hypothetical protein
MRRTSGLLGLFLAIGISLSPTYAGNPFAEGFDYIKAGK